MVGAAVIGGSGDLARERLLTELGGDDDRLAGLDVGTNTDRQSREICNEAPDPVELIGMDPARGGWSTASDDELIQWPANLVVEHR